ncbi:MAG: SCP2 sterol-binding domain-containing protein [Lachnospiraceae bacterium]|nr:SCP2 sterol-binding domain-containing protein [Lachnospiraceae bacterium]
MKVNLYYGGRGLIEDPTLYVMNRVVSVLEELRVQVVKYNLYEQRNNITVLSNTLKEADGIILAVNVEWLGIGGYMHEFLDSCWLYGNKEKIRTMYMMPIVVATTYGERDAENMLVKAWELMGGLSAESIGVFVENQAEFETSMPYRAIIEKKAEAFYRIMNQKGRILPSSNYVVKKSIPVTLPLDLTPQESEQLSKYVSDDARVQKQKKDIEELAELFKGMLGSEGGAEERYEFEKNFKENFKPQGKDFHALYSVYFTDVEKTLIIEISGESLRCYYGEKNEDEVDMAAKTTREVMNKIVNGRTTFQGAFMSGELTCKGNFKTLRNFDNFFTFNILS